ncbi:MAG: hypothetical protein ACI9U0_000212 [Flavobacteriales bacterium]
MFSQVLISDYAFENNCFEFRNNNFMNDYAESMYYVCTNPKENHGDFVSCGESTYGSRNEYSTTNIKTSDLS